MERVLGWRAVLGVLNGCDGLAHSLRRLLAEEDGARAVRAESTQASFDFLKAPRVIVDASRALLEAVG